MNRGDLRSVIAQGTGLMMVILKVLLGMSDPVDCVLWVCWLK